MTVTNGRFAAIWGVRRVADSDGAESGGSADWPGRPVWVPVRMSKRVLFYLIVGLVGVVLPTVSAELMLRSNVPWIMVERELFYDDPYPASASDYLPFTLPPDMDLRHQSPEFDVHYRTNGLGYRGRYPETVPKTSGRQRMLVNGDSFTLGWGSSEDDSFVGRLQRALGGHWEVINAGYRGGYSPDSYFAYLMREGLALHPDVLLQVLYPENDLADMRENSWHEVDELGAPHRVETWRLYPDHQGRVILTPERRERLARWYLRVPFLNQVHLFVGAATLLTPGTPEPEPRLPMNEAWSRFAKVVAATRAMAQEAEIPLLYVLIPPDPERASRAQFALHGRVAQELAAQGAQWVDLLPTLSGQDAYFAQDGHFNPNGNAIAARSILEALEEFGLVLSQAGR